MQVLLHIGLNKCGSTFLQAALDHARPALKAAGTWYPAQVGPPCQYGLSKAYGFGPDAPEIKEKRVGQLIDEASLRGCNRLILSSEYLSLHRPKAARQLWSDLTAHTDQARVVVFSRDVFGWIRSLFNQYVKTVEGMGQLDDINAFVDQVLRNRAIDLAGRIAMWRDLVPEGVLQHYSLDGLQDWSPALGVFETFSGLTVELEPPEAENQSLDTAALHRIGQLRRKLPTVERDAEIARLMSGGASPYPAPEGYLDISPDRRARIIREIIAPYQALPRIALTVAQGQTEQRTPSLTA